MYIRAKQFRYLPAIALLAGLLSTSSLASASVIVTGGAIPNPIPTSLLQGAPNSTSDTLFYVVPEATNVITPIDLQAGGIIGNGVIIPMGTVVDAYIIHASPTSQAGSFAYSGTLTFDSQILGIYVSNTSLNATDIYAIQYGSPVINYPTGFSNRGLELSDGGTDILTLSPDQRTITISLNTPALQMDEFRVLVATPTPEPSSIGMAGLGLVSLGFVLYRRRRA